jgi:diaminopimelate decarboxylase
VKNSEGFHNLALASALSRFGCCDGKLVIGGRMVTDLAEEFGTPMYIYDRGWLARQREKLRSVLPEEIKISYAVKANPNAELIQIMGELYEGFDIASQGEMEKVIASGISPSRLSFAGPGKSTAELRAAVECGIGSISVESEREIEILQSVCQSLGKRARILIRVNPPFELAQSGMKMGGGPKAFGIDSEMLPQVIARIKNHDALKLEGIHIFSGSQNLEAAQLLATFEKIFEYADGLSQTFHVFLKTLNLGGGFGIPYFAHETDLDLTAVGAGLRVIVENYRQKLKGTKLVLELGRFLVGECGIYLCRILYRKVSYDRVFLITDGGMHHHLAASGNFGQSLVRRPMPLTIANRLKEPLEKVTVCGRLCTPLDTFGTVEIPRAKEGDLIAVMNSGAYGLTASPVDFLNHPPAKEILV